MKYDLKAMKPSLERRLAVELQGADTRVEFIERLKQYLAEEPVLGEADLDQATSLAVRLSALGIWNLVSDQFLEMSKAVTNERLAAFCKGVPIALRQALYESIDRPTKTNRTTAEGKPYRISFSPEASSFLEAYSRTSRAAKYETGLLLGKAEAFEMSFSSKLSEMETRIMGRHKVMTLRAGRIAAFAEIVPKSKEANVFLTIQIESFGDLRRAWSMVKEKFSTEVALTLPEASTNSSKNFRSIKVK